MKNYRVIKNTDDPELLAEIERQLKENNGYCPCRPQKTAETRCICKEFREQLADDDFEGECHCGRFIKVNITKDEDMTKFVSERKSRK